jgi:hypothetical protein
MTAYMPSLTLPAFVFEQPAVSVLLPVLGGAAIGSLTRRMSLEIAHSQQLRLELTNATGVQLSAPRKHIAL